MASSSRGPGIVVGSPSSPAVTPAQPRPAVPVVLGRPRSGAPVVSPRPPAREQGLGDHTDVELDSPRAPGVAAAGVLVEDALGVWRREDELPAELLPDLGAVDAQPIPQRYVQTQPAARWQVVHMLGYRPVFTCHTPDGLLLVPENVEHPVPGEISEIVFGAPFPGTADPS